MSGLPARNNLNRKKRPRARISLAGVNVVAPPEQGFQQRQVENNDVSSPTVASLPPAGIPLEEGLGLNLSFDREPSWENLAKAAEESSSEKKNPDKTRTSSIEADPNVVNSATKSHSDAELSEISTEFRSLETQQVPGTSPPSERDSAAANSPPPSVTPEEEEMVLDDDLRMEEEHLMQQLDDEITHAEEEEILAELEQEIEKEEAIAIEQRIPARTAQASTSPGQKPAMSSNNNTIRKEWDLPGFVEDMGNDLTKKEFDDFLAFFRQSEKVRDSDKAEQLHADLEFCNGSTKHKTKLVAKGEASLVAQLEMASKSWAAYRTDMNEVRRVLMDGDSVMFDFLIYDIDARGLVFDTCEWGYRDTDNRKGVPVRISKSLGGPLHDLFGQALGNSAFAVISTDRNGSLKSAMELKELLDEVHEKKDSCIGLTFCLSADIDLSLVPRMLPKLRWLRLCGTDGKLKEHLREGSEVLGMAASNAVYTTAIPSSPPTSIDEIERAKRSIMRSMSSVEVDIWVDLTFNLGAGCLPPQLGNEYIWLHMFQPGGQMSRLLGKDIEVSGAVLLAIDGVAIKTLAQFERIRERPGPRKLFVLTLVFFDGINLKDINRNKIDRPPRRRNGELYPLLIPQERILLEHPPCDSAFTSALPSLPINLSQNKLNQTCESMLKNRRSVVVEFWVPTIVSLGAKVFPGKEHAFLEFLPDGILAQLLGKEYGDFGMILLEMNGARIKDAKEFRVHQVKCTSEKYRLKLLCFDGVDLSGVDRYHLAAPPRRRSGEKYPLQWGRKAILEWGPSTFPKTSGSTEELPSCSKNLTDDAIAKIRENRRSVRLKLRLPSTGQLGATLSFGYNGGWLRLHKETASADGDGSGLLSEVLGKSFRADVLLVETVNDFKINSTHEFRKQRNSQFPDDFVISVLTFHDVDLSSLDCTKLVACPRRQNGERYPLHTHKQDDPRTLSSTLDMSKSISHGNIDVDTHSTDALVAPSVNAKSTLNRSEGAKKKISMCIPRTLMEKDGTSIILDKRSFDRDFYQSIFLKKVKQKHMDSLLKGFSFNVQIQDTGTKPGSSYAVVAEGDATLVDFWKTNLKSWALSLKKTPRLPQNAINEVCKPKKGADGLENLIDAPAKGKRDADGAVSPHGLIRTSDIPESEPSTEVDYGKVINKIVQNARSVRLKFHVPSKDALGATIQFYAGNAILSNFKEGGVLSLLLGKAYQGDGVVLEYVNGMKVQTLAEFKNERKNCFEKSRDLELWVLCSHSVDLSSIDPSMLIESPQRQNGEPYLLPLDSPEGSNSSITTKRKLDTGVEADSHESSFNDTRVNQSRKHQKISIPHEKGNATPPVLGNVAEGEDSGYNTDDHFASKAANLKISDTYRGREVPKGSSADSVLNESNGNLSYAHGELSDGGEKTPHHEITTKHKDDSIDGDFPIEANDEDHEDEIPENNDPMARRIRRRGLTGSDMIDGESSSRPNKHQKTKSLIANMVASGSGPMKPKKVVKYDNFKVSFDSSKPLGGYFVDDVTSKSCKVHSIALGGQIDREKRIRKGTIVDAIYIAGNREQVRNIYFLKRKYESAGHVKRPLEVGFKTPILSNFGSVASVDKGWSHDGQWEGGDLAGWAGGAVEKSNIQSTYKTLRVSASNRPQKSEKPKITFKVGDEITIPTDVESPGQKPLERTRSISFGASRALIIHNRADLPVSAEPSPELPVQPTQSPYDQFWRAVDTESCDDLIDILEGGASQIPNVICPGLRDGHAKVKESLGEVERELEFKPEDKKLGRRKKELESKKKVLSIYDNTLLCLEKALNLQHWVCFELRLVNADFSLTSDTERKLTSYAKVHAEIFYTFPGQRRRAERLGKIEKQEFSQYMIFEGSSTMKVNNNPCLPMELRQLQVDFFFSEGSGQSDSSAFASFILPCNAISERCVNYDDSRSIVVPVSTPNFKLTNGEITVEAKRVRLDKKYTEAKAVEAFKGLYGQVDWIRQFNEGHSEKLSPNIFGRGGISVLNAAVRLVKPALVRIIRDQGYRFLASIDKLNDPLAEATTTRDRAKEKLQLKLEADKKDENAIRASQHRVKELDEIVELLTKMSGMQAA